MQNFAVQNFLHFINYLWEKTEYFSVVSAIVKCVGVEYCQYIVVPDWFYSSLQPPIWSDKGGKISEGILIFTLSSKKFQKNCKFLLCRQFVLSFCKDLTKMKIRNMYVTYEILQPLTQDWYIRHRYAYLITYAAWLPTHSKKA